MKPFKHYYVNTAVILELKHKEDKYLNLILKSKTMQSVNCDWS